MKQPGIRRASLSCADSTLNFFSRKEIKNKPLHDRSHRGFHLTHNGDDQRAIINF